MLLHGVFAAKEMQHDGARGTLRTGSKTAHRLAAEVSALYAYISKNGTFLCDHERRGQRLTWLATCLELHSMLSANNSARQHRGRHSEPAEQAQSVPAQSVFPQTMT